MNVDMADDLKISFCEFTSIHFINHSQIGLVFCIVFGQLFFIVILIFGLENKDTVLHQLLRLMFVISKSKSARDMLNSDVNIVTISSHLISFFIIIYF